MAIDTATGKEAPAEISSDRVKDIFSTIAKKYERFNAISSFGAYKMWLAGMMKQAPISANDDVLDIAGGTGDVSFTVARAKHPRHIQCTDLVDEMLDDGIEAAVICYGLHEAAKAPSPSWRYAAAVIARCVREGIRTAADLSTSQARAKSTARSTGWPQARKVREQMYTQREYQETDELPAWMQERIRQMHPL